MNKLSQEEIDALLKGSSFKNMEPTGEKKGKGDFPGEEEKASSEKEKRHPPLVEKVEFAPLKQQGKIYGQKPRLHLFDDIKLKVCGELGTAVITVRELLRLKEGSVIKLDKMAGESAAILVNEQYLGQAEVVVINDRFGLRVTSVGFAEEDSPSKAQGGRSSISSSGPPSEKSPGKGE